MQYLSLQDSYGRDKMKLCECGCGNPAPISKFNRKERGQKKGEPIRFISGHNSKLQPIGKKSPLWNGGKTTNNGRIMLYNPNHPRANVKGYVFRTILIVEKAIGKFLSLKHEVHHIDGSLKNDENKNLIVCESHAYHLSLHRKKRALDACGNPNWWKCGHCKQYDDPYNLYKNPKTGRPLYHSECKNRYDRERKKNAIRLLSSESYGEI